MANAKTEAKNSYGDTPLHTAARYGHAGAARILLSAKCDPNQVNKNHDTPLHIAAAMGRRKLTKIFMQNGSEPAIKNKQNETPMDIALKKDLIDIQELIANPPPIETAKQQQQRKSTAAATHRLFSPESPSPDRLRQRQRHQHQQARRNSRAECRRHHSQRDRRRATDPFDSNSSSGADELAEANNGSRQPRNSRNKLAHGSSLDRAAQQRSELLFGRDHLGERARDEPDKWGVALSSARSMSALAKDRAADRRLRARTLGGGSTDLQLGCVGLKQLAAATGDRRRSCDDTEQQQQPIAMRLVMRRRSKTLAAVEGPTAAPTNPPDVGSAGENREGAGRLLPDAKPLLEEWNELAAKRIRATPTVIEEPNNIDEDEDEDAAGATRKNKSPSGSLRSSLSKSRGKLLLNRRYRRAKTLVRRPNLGTCVGKLSLLKLRNMVNQAGKVSRQQQASDPKPAEDADEDEDEDEAESDARKPIIVEGRRQERLKQQRQQLRAPNGTRLVSTRLLAPLDDETQLYAIPKKTKTTSAAAGDKQQVASGGPTSPAATSSSGAANRDTESSAATRQQRLLEPSQRRRHHQQQQADDQLAPAEDRTPSGGPALTSDGGQSSSSAASSASSTFPADNNNNNSNNNEDDASASSRIASSSDECIGAIRTSSGAGHSVPTRDERRAPALVGVHGLDRADSSCSATNCTGEQARPPRQPANETRPEAPKQVAAGQQQAATASSRAAAGSGRQTKTTSSKLRQFLHLESRPRAAKQEAPMSAVAGGYYAYSPVVQSSGDISGQTEQQQQAPSTAAAAAAADSKSSGTTKTSSWIRNKLSLAPATNHNRPSEAACNGLPRAEIVAEQAELGDDLLVEAPERRAELISVERTSGDHRQPQNGDQQQPVQADDGLIRPRSALSAASAELIAAQKSLAAAAAAKVKRDRMAKIMSVAGDEFEEQQQQLTTAASLLTVKTCEPSFWPTHHHHHPHPHPQQQLHHLNLSLNHQIAQPMSISVEQPAGVAAGKPFVLMVGQPVLVEQQQQRSGANSVGMSDSSPSNNGAESDNSIRTTSGSSTNTTRSDSAAQQANGSGSGSDPDQSANSSPLGMLSRILLNNKSIGRPTFSSAPAPATPAANNSSTSTEATLVEESEQQQPQESRLDQLASRSRRPIVLTKSNESAAPQLPPKGSPAGPQLGAGSQLQRRSDSPHLGVMNGLPRVASYTQISTLAGGGAVMRGAAQLLVASQQRRQPLCDYHAFARHSAYSEQPFHVASSSNQDPNRDHIHEHQHLDQRDDGRRGLAFFAAAAAGREPAAAPLSSGNCLARSYSAASHQDLGSLQMQQPPPAHPASVINYEYYLEPTTALNGAHHDRNYIGGDARHHYHNRPANDNSIYPLAGSGHDESIYVRHSLSTSSASASASSYANANANQIRDCSAQRRLPFAAGRPSHNGLQQRQARPKSSLDTFLFQSNLHEQSGGGGGANQSNQIPTNSNNNNGRQQSNDSSATTTTISNGTKGNRPAASSSSMTCNGSTNIQTATMSQQRSTDQLAVISHHNQQQQQHQRRSSFSSRHQSQQQPLLLGCSEYFSNSPHLSQPAAAYYSPFIHHNGNTSSASYSTDYHSTLAASNGQPEHQSDLTVLPAPAASSSGCGAAAVASMSCQLADSYHRKQSPSSPSIELAAACRSDAAAIAVAEGGYAAAATTRRASDEVGSGAAAAAADNEPSGAVEKTTANGHGERRRPTNSWTPAPATYKSLVHINQSSPDKSNQSSASRVSVSSIKRSLLNGTANNGTGAPDNPRTVLLTNGQKANGSSNVLIDKRSAVMKSSSLSPGGTTEPKRIDFSKLNLATRLTSQQDNKLQLLDQADASEDEDEDGNEECSRSTML